MSKNTTRAASRLSAVLFQDLGSAGVVANILI
jgi:hypothetical protein